jgi:2-dehydro-3-deoxygluconokinase
MKPLVGFGEIMGRLAPPGFLRFAQAMPGPMDVSFAGAEANVAVSVVNYGGTARYVTALPKNAVADACVAALRAMGVDTRFVKRVDEGRVGLYFVETGANQRPGNVVYDRAGSSISLTPGNAYPWDDILDGAGWLHLSGITPALSRTAAEATLLAAQTAHAKGVVVSCDLNFRTKLWQWDPPTSAKQLARETMGALLASVDMVVGNEEDASVVLGITAGSSDVESGRLEIDRYPDVARQIVKKFPNVSRVAITLRESISASHNNWGGMLYEAASDTAHFAPVVDGAYRPYEIRAIVDRVGSGDAFAGGLIYALNDDALREAATAVAFAVAASCLAHSIKGDFNYCSRAEVEALAGGAASGRVVR